MTALELLQELNSLDEHPRIEAKTGSEAGKAALRTVCAFANEPGLGGGHLLFGLAPSDDLFGERYQVAGVPDPDKLQQISRRNVGPSSIGPFALRSRSRAWTRRRW